MILGAGFGLVALTGPLAFAGALLRPAGSGASIGDVNAGGFAAPLLAGLIAFGLALLVKLALDAAQLRAIKHAARPIGTVAVRRARIAISEAVASPTAIGYLHPAIVLPASFRQRVDEDEWNAVIAHEAAHLARGDDWGKAVQSAVLRVGWWLPGLWILARAIDLEREAASDERAVRETGVRRYAACLLRLATSDTSPGLAPAFRGRRAHIAIRVERLLRPGPAPSRALRAAVLGASSAVTLAALATAIAAVPAVGRSGTSAVSSPRLAAVGERRAARWTPVARSSVRRPAPALIAAVALPAPGVRPRHPAAATPRVHHLKAARPAVVPVVGMLPLRPRCATCFGPLRSPDTAVDQSGPTVAPLAPDSVAIATGSGSDSLRFGLMSLLPPRAVAIP